MKLVVAVEEIEPGRWLATAGGCQVDGVSEEEALGSLRRAVFESRRWAGSGYSRA